MSSGLVREMRAWRAPVLFSLIVSGLLVFWVLPVKVAGPSMDPTLSSGDTLLAERTPMAPIARGDIVVFRPLANSDVYLIKRVIGIPGDRIRFIDFGVWLNGRRLYESYVRQPWTLDDSYLSGGELTLANDEYFLMGDYRDQSTDSRQLGPQPRSRIVGRVWLRIWPISRASAWFD